MMEKLCERFVALQDKLLEHFEEGSDDLAHQVEYWSLLRHEAALMFVARRQGLRRLSYHQIPTLQVCEAKAKEAIRMQLMLSSLLQTPHAVETWTLTDTSAETVLHTEPKGCLKRGPYTVRVTYDGVQENSVFHTAWTSIYCQNADGEWYKTSGKVAHEGLWYDGPCGDPVWYVDFHKEAKTYSKKGEWTVVAKNRIVSPSVSSTTPPCRQNRGWCNRWSSDEGGHRSPKRRKLTYAPTPDSTDKRLKWPSGSGGAQQETPDGPTSSAHKGELARRLGGGSASPTSTQEGSQSQSPRGQFPTVPGGPSPQVDSVSANPRGNHDGRPSPVEGGPGACSVTLWPVLLIRGPKNPLKCWKFRCKNKHCSLFCSATNTFDWGVGGDQDGRMLVSFSSEAQRRAFLDTVPIPSQFTVSFGSMNGL